MPCGAQSSKIVITPINNKIKQTIPFPVTSKVLRPTFLLMKIVTILPKRVNPVIVIDT